MQAVLTLCVLCGNSFPQDWRTVADGVEYAQVRREFSGKSVDINLLRLDLKKVRLDVHHAMEMAIGTEKTSSIAMRHGAIAAINAGFFRLDSSIWAGDAAGVMMINNRLLSESQNNRTALFIRNFGDIQTEVRFAPINLGSTFKIGDRTFRFTGINRERKSDELIEYTPEFGRSTLTNGDGLEIVVFRDRILAIKPDLGSSEIPTSGFVISATGKMRDELIPHIRIGKKIMRYTGVSHDPRNRFPNQDSRLTDDAFSGAEDITNGVPQLIRNGKIDITWEHEKASRSFVETRHPRTAVAKLKDGKFLMLTADGRTDASGGLDLYDLAEYMLEIGATDAMNLDGGGSTTMFLGGKVVNRPSDKEGERKVGDAILVTLRSAKRAR